MKFVLFVFCADFRFSFSISFCAKIIKISKSSLKCKICVQVCVCVWGTHSCGSVAERERKRWREGAYCSIYSTYSASSATQFPSSYESRSFNSFTCISLYLPRPPPLPFCSVRQFKFVLFNSDSVKLKKYHTDYNLAHRMRARAKDWPIKPTGFGRDNSQQIREYHNQSHKKSWEISSKDALNNQLNWGGPSSLRAVYCFCFSLSFISWHTKKEEKNWTL